MLPKRIYDIIGIGIGPFNLGLAALAGNIPELDCLFFDQAERFDWHPGLLLDGTRLQVPFYADLVTLADPTSRFSYLNYLKRNQKLFRFAIHEQHFPTRKEYNRYCQWVAAELSNLRFSSRCERIDYCAKTKVFTIDIDHYKNGLMERFHAKHVVIGVGTVPDIPASIKTVDHPLVFHSGQYLFKKKELQNKTISIIGSGQSAAEIFSDLLSGGVAPERLQWFTRSERFFPMDYSKFSLEMTSPDYVQYFYHLSEDQKRAVLQSQHQLYKGINFSLINQVYDQLYLLGTEEQTKGPTMCTSCILEEILEEENLFHLFFTHNISKEKFSVVSEAVILATGYKNDRPDFIKGLDGVCYEKVKENYSIDDNNRVFVQNADLHSHGFNSADLGMGPYRNGVILNSILEREQFVFEKNIAFQTFGVMNK